MLFRFQVTLIPIVPRSSAGTTTSITGNTALGKALFNFDLQHLYFWLHIRFSLQSKKNLS